MSAHGKQGKQRFTLDQLRDDRSRVAAAAKQDGGCLVVDKNGQTIFTLCIPQGPLGNDD